MQLAISPDNAIPSEQEIHQWASHVLAQESTSNSITLRLVDEAEGQVLNQQFRHKDYATNVLSFPAEEEEELGDVVICWPIILREAQEQGKTPSAHLAHMVIHGILHLLGYDHETDSTASIMEAKESTLLAEMGFENPYLS